MTIHLIIVGKYQDKKNWPGVWSACFESLSKSEHDICIWNDEDIDKILNDDDQEFCEKYLNKLDIIYKIDYARYVILEKHGGTYFDMDIELRMDFLPLVDPQTTYILEGSMGELVSNAIIITYKGCSIWGFIKDKAKFNIIQYFNLAKENSFNTVKLIGPLFLSKWVANFWNVSSLQKSNKPRIELLGFHQFNNPLNTLSFTKHHSTHVWGGNKENMVK